MNDKPTLREYLLQLAKDQPGIKAKPMLLFALKAGYTATPNSIHQFRYQEGLTDQYSTTRVAKTVAARVKSARKAGARKKSKGRRKYKTAGEAMAAKLAARRVRRAVLAEVAKPKAEEKEGTRDLMGALSSTERAFMDAAAVIGMERAEKLLVRFKKAVRS